MNNKLYLKQIIFLLLILLIIYLYTLPRYIKFLPTIPVYDNSEADEVYEITKKRNFEDVRFFELTDDSITTAFLPHINESYEEIEKIIKSYTVYIILILTKYIINRPRPYQINKNIEILDSKTGFTPAMPAGHAFQAYYLAVILSKRYPYKKEKFDEIAKKCDDCRVKAGIHYPSDGEFSKKIVNYLNYLKLI